MLHIHIHIHIQVSITSIHKMNELLMVGDKIVWVVTN